MQMHSDIPGRARVSRVMIDWYPPQASAGDGLGSDPSQIETDRRAERFVRAVAKRNPELADHARRSAGAAVAIAGEIGWGADERLLLHQAALLHDVGMLKVAEGVRTKVGALSVLEYQQVMEHAELGAAMVGEVLNQEQVSWVRHHHERPDGRGYPNRLGGGEVPIAASIIALADAWVAMTRGRPYRAAISGDRALAECWRNTGRQFAPEAVEALIALWRRTGDETLIGARDGVYGAAPLGPRPEMASLRATA
jgi:HD-GYP domain-containing protein (c-di-GMP phosphodiesterase class II)